MTKRIVFFFIGIFVATSGAQAQGIDVDADHLGLQVGDTLPAMVLRNVLHVPGGTIDTRNLRGKFLILDFWDISCGSCIDAFPRMEHLQQLFQGQVQIVLVGPQTLAELKRRPAVFQQLPPLPAITGDTVLRKLFPHQIVPHHVWIDTAGTIMAITDGLNSDSNHIAALVKGEKVMVSSKRPIGFRRNDRLISLFRTPIRPTYYSLMFPAIPDHQSFGFPSVDSASGKLNAYTFYNYSILELFRVCLDRRADRPFFRKNRVIVDSAIRKMMEYTFSYELSVMPGSADSLFAIMRSELNLFFGLNYGIHGTIDTKRTMSLVISIADRTKLNKDTGTEREIFAKDTILAVADYPYELAFGRIALDLQDLPEPVVDNTGYHGKITLAIKHDMHDLTSLKKDLRDAGLLLEEREMNIDYLALRAVKAK